MDDTYYYDQDYMPAWAIVLIIALAIFQIAAMWKVFTKAGQPGWAAIIPIYNIYIMTKNRRQTRNMDPALPDPFCQYYFYHLAVQYDIQKLWKRRGFYSGISAFRNHFLAHTRFRKCKIPGALWQPRIIQSIPGKEPF